MATRQIPYVTIEAVQRLAEAESSPPSLGTAEAFQTYDRSGSLGQSRSQSGDQRRHIKWLASIALAITVFAIFILPRRPNQSAIFRSPNRPLPSYNSQKLVWSSSKAHPRLTQKFFNAPLDAFRFSHFHSIIRSQKGTVDSAEISDLYVHTLAFVEKTPFTPKEGRQWHVYLPDSLDTFQRIECEFAHRSGSNKMRYSRSSGLIEEFKDRVGLKIFCPLPELATNFVNDLSSADKQLELTIKMISGTHVALEETIKLEATRVASDPGENSVSICLAPAFGKLDAKKMLLWREHHRLMGIDNVHWYARPGVDVNLASMDTLGVANMTFESWIAKYNKITGTSDSLVRAPRLNDDLVGDPAIENGGEYIDQVPYMSDCQLRALSNPSQSEWIAFIDTDEFMFPQPFVPAAQLTSNAFKSTLEAALPETGAVCVARWHVDRLAILDLPLPSDFEPKPTRFTFPIGAIGPARAPHPGEQYDNAKCWYRAKAIDEAHVHNPDRLFQQSKGVDYKTVNYYGDGGIRIVHLGWWENIADSDNFAGDFESSPAFRQYLATLWQEYLKITQKMQSTVTA